MSGDSIQGLLDLMQSQNVRGYRQIYNSPTNTSPTLDPQTSQSAVAWRGDESSPPMRGDPRHVFNRSDLSEMTSESEQAAKGYGRRFRPVWYGDDHSEIEAPVTKRITPANPNCMPTHSIQRMVHETHRYRHPPSGKDLVQPPPAALTCPSPSKLAGQARATLNSSPFFQQSSPNIFHPPRSADGKDAIKPVAATDQELSNAFPKPRRPLAASVMSLEATFGPTVSSTGFSMSQNGPVVNGIRLVTVSALPDRLQEIFPFRLLNAVQSKCFGNVFETDDNFVMSAPTGSGKTALLELAICRLSLSHQQGFKVIYMAPTKSLCSEKAREWQTKFRVLNLTCAEITGDTANVDSAQSIQKADIIVTTPEKWDSLTRKWKDHKNMMLAVKLLLIDEIHILGESRGATLEVIISRMKSMSSEARLIALSATIPNISDVAEWLGKSFSQPETPAPVQTFGEEYRPVKLERHVHELKEFGNGYQIDAACDRHLPNIIDRHSKRQPILVFCFTKKSCEGTAKLLKDKRGCDRRAEAWWPLPHEPVQVESPELADVLVSGVAYHHAGLKAGEREAVETGFCNGRVSVICCTSTLAVGVNLPCHMVVIKNTLSYGEDGPREYSDLEIMQMLGRAGRPQYQSAGAVAVIITQSSKADRYRRLVAGEVLVESSLHLGLIEHMNAEIGLGAVQSFRAAQSWLKGTFLYVRLRQNPAHYKIKSGTKSSNLEERVASICNRDIDLLIKAGLVTGEAADTGGALSCTPLGDAMARYYVRFTSMKTFLSLPRQSDLPAVLGILTQADELSTIRLRQTEIKKYQDINKSNSELRFKAVEVSTRAHKAFIITQMELGGCKPPMDGMGRRVDGQYLQDRNLIFGNLPRLVRCIIDCHIHLRDAVTVRNGLELARSLSSRMWDDAPAQLQLIPGIGPVNARKLASAGITNIELMRDSDPAKVAMVTGKRGEAEKFWHEAQSYPIPRISVSLQQQGLAQPMSRVVNFKLDLGFLNRKAPERYNKKPVYLCIVVERSDGRLIEFKRIRAGRVNEPILLREEMTSPTDTITCHVMCEELIGTLRSAVLHPNISESAFGSNSISTSESARNGDETNSHSRSKAHEASNINNEDNIATRTISEQLRDLDDIDEADLVAAEVGAMLQRRAAGPDVATTSGRTKVASAALAGPEARHLLLNGKYECNHCCKDKTSCRHLCCREGLDQPPRQSRADRKGKGGKDTNLCRHRPASEIDHRRPLSGDPDIMTTTRQPLGPKRKRPKVSDGKASGSESALASGHSGAEPYEMQRPPLTMSGQNRKRRPASPVRYSDDFEDVDTLLGTTDRGDRTTELETLDGTSEGRPEHWLIDTRVGKYSSKFEEWLTGSIPQEMDSGRGPHH